MALRRAFTFLILLKYGKHNKDFIWAHPRRLFDAEEGHKAILIPELKFVWSSNLASVSFDFIF